MKRFTCGCGARLFFDSVQCAQCGRAVGFDPKGAIMRALEPDGAGGWVAAEDARQALAYCANGVQYGICNWVLDPGDGEAFCPSCRLNETIPNLATPGNPERWSTLEQAKRRLLYSLQRLGLEWTATANLPMLGFRFLEDQRTNPAVTEQHVFTGYGKGLITINVAEADGVMRERTREAMNEAYRTVLGHMRHESGHYFWERLVRDEPPTLSAFRDLFGDDGIDYGEALARYHAQGPVPDWQGQYISTYAQSHPLEDFAESWAHYLHMVDTLETAHANGMAPERPDPGDRSAHGFDRWVAEWLALSVALNELNRSMGLPDAYPFVLSTGVIAKLRFVSDLVSSRSDPTRSPAIP